MSDAGLDSSVLRCDVAVIGAGPAGMASATAAAKAGAHTVLFDEQTRPGGQIFKDVERPSSPYFGRAGHHAKAKALVDDLRSSKATCLQGASVWGVERGGVLNVTHRSRSLKMLAKKIVIATGAQERPLPIEGWTKPGVLTAGGAQILLKTAAVVPAGRVVLVGIGPLLWTLASQYLAFDVTPTIVELRPPKRLMRSARYLAAFLASPYLAPGVKLMFEVRRKCCVVSGVQHVRIIGDRCVRGISYRSYDGSEGNIACDTVIVHSGINPNLQLQALLDLEQTWNSARHAWESSVDDWGASSDPDVYVAGDAAAIVGVDASIELGRLAGLDAAQKLGCISLEERDARAGEPRRRLRRYKRGRDFLDTFFGPPDVSSLLGDESTVVCRCEEVTLGEITRHIRSGCPGPNQLKAFLRCGMGPCQGRFCSATVNDVFHRITGRSHEDIGSFRIRPPVKPITLAELSTHPTTKEERSTAKEY